METIFVGSCFVAKYPEEGGNFSVVLQYLLGLRRMNRRAIWLEILKSTGDEQKDRMLASSFRRRLTEYGLEDSYCLMIQSRDEQGMSLDTMKFKGIRHRELKDLLAGPNTLLNLRSCEISLMKPDWKPVCGA